MLKWKFRKLFQTQVERVEKEGKKSSAWFLGYVEGLGNKKLTGYQIGALVHLLVLPDINESEKAPVEIKELASEESKDFSITDIL